MRDYGGAPLLGSGSPFAYERRKLNDVVWAVLYVALMGGCVALGVYGVVNREPRFDTLTSADWLADPTHCPAPGSTAITGSKPHPDAPPSQFLAHAGVWVAGSVAAALCLGLCFLALLQARPAALVGAAIVVQVALPLAGAGVAFSQAATPVGAVLVVSSALMALAFYLWREQLRLVSRLLGVSAKGLAANPGIVALTLGLQLVMVPLAVLMAVAAFFAYQNGGVAPNPAARLTGGAGKGGGDAPTCVDASGQEVPCCMWQVDSWVPFGMAVQGLAMLWTVFLIFEIKVFTISGAIAQWYFTPVAAPAPSRSRTLVSLNHALSSSFGSLCLASLLLTLISQLRRALQEAQERRARDGQPNLLLDILSACAGGLLSLLEGITKFATVQMAITGQPFISAGRSVVSLLSRNLMDTAAVWWLPPLVMQSCVLMAAAGWGTAVYYASSAMWGHAANGAAAAAAHNSAVILAVLAGLSTWMVLAFLASLLLNVLDAAYVCFAMDRDADACSRPEIHELYSQLPSVGKLVEQPDETSYAYAQPLGLGGAEEGGYHPMPTRG